MLFMQRHIGGGMNGFAVDPSGQRFLLVVPDQKVSPPITVFLNWPSLLSRSEQMSLSGHDRMSPTSSAMSSDVRFRVSVSVTYT